MRIDENHLVCHMGEVLENRWGSCCAGMIPQTVSYSAELSGLDDEGEGGGSGMEPGPSIGSS